MDSNSSAVCHRRQVSVPPPRRAPSPARATAPPPATFWTRHPVVAALAHDVLLWVRPAATALAYGALVWLFFIVRALLPHSDDAGAGGGHGSTSAALFVVGAGAVLGTLALRWAAETLGQSPVLACLARAPVLLCAPPRDAAALAARAARVERTVEAARARVVAVLCELHLAARDAPAEEGAGSGAPAEEGAGAEEAPARLTVLGKTVLGVACLAMALVTSLARTGTLVAGAALVLAAVPPVVHYDLVGRFFEALSSASQAAQKQGQQGQQGQQQPPASDK